MVYGLVKQLGGQIEVHSKVDSGSTVELFLPRCRATTGARGRLAKRRVTGR